MPTRSIFLSVLSILIFAGATPVFSASTRIQTESYTTGNSQSNISVNQVDIVIDADGEKQEYHSDSGEDVTITSQDGKSVINVNNSGSQQSQTSPSSTPKSSATPQASHTPILTSLTPATTPTDRQQEAASSDRSFFATILHWLINLF